MAVEPWPTPNFSSQATGHNKWRARWEDGNRVYPMTPEVLGDVRGRVSFTSWREWLVENLEDALASQLVADIDVNYGRCDGETGAFELTIRHELEHAPLVEDVLYILLGSWLETQGIIA